MIRIAALLLALLATPAMASLTGMTPEVRAADEYLIGVSGRSGDWIDAIRPVCASWNPATECGAVPAPGTTLPAGTIPELHGTLYRDPEIAAENTEMVRLYWCREWGSAFGKPAADAYCQMLGHARSGKAICSDPTCDGFRLVECVD